MRLLTQRGRAYLSSTESWRKANSRRRSTWAPGTVSCWASSPSACGPPLLNVFDSFYWQPDASGTLYPNPQRDFDLTLQAQL